MTAKPQLLKLLKIQDLALEIRGARAVLQAAPQRLEEIEGRFRERNAEYVALRERHEALESDNRDRNGQLQVMGETQKHYMDSLMQVKNQREYSAMLKEIDTVKAQIAAHEETILANLTEIESLTADLAARESHIAEERAMVESERAQVLADEKTANDRIAEGEAERAAIEKDLPRELVENVRRVEEMRQGLFLARADKETCQSCFVRVRPQVYQEIRQSLRVHTCANCRRYLFHEPTLRASGKASASPDAPAVEATNGGAV